LLCLCSAQTSVNERRSKIENEDDDENEDDWGFSNRPRTSHSEEATSYQAEATHADMPTAGQVSLTPARD